MSYVEIIPVLIEAFKEHLIQHQNVKHDVQNQLDLLKAKLDLLETGKLEIIFSTVFI